MKRIVWLLCLCAALLALAGCSGTRQAEAPQEAPVVLPYASSLAKQGITGSITLPKRPERVVTLTNSPVLALYELGVPQAAVPDTKILQWPEGLEKQAKKIQTGMRSNIDLESVIAPGSMQRIRMGRSWSGKESPSITSRRVRPSRLTR